MAPRGKQTCTRKGQKVDPLEIKSGSIWRVQFWPLHVGTCVAKSPIYARGKISSLTQATSAAGVLNWGGPCYVAAFSHLFWAKKRPLDFYNFLNFHSRGRRGPRDLSRPASTCFETCLQPCFILRNFRFTTISIHSPAAWKPALRPSLCASCGLKFWQASKVPNSFRVSGLLGLQQ